MATVVTMTEVDLRGPAFGEPSKFVGPVYTDAEAHRWHRRTGGLLSQTASTGGV
jgi:carbamate kinase